MKISTLYKLTYIYLAFPLFIFIVSWLNLIFAAPLALVFGYAFYKIYSTQPEDNEAYFNSTGIVLMATVALIWCFFAGIGYFYYQSFDYHFRNAVFRDLINYDWPVFYNRANTPLVYYMAFWLVPSVMAKFFGLFIADTRVLFILGNIFLLLYAVIGVFLIFAHLARALKLPEKKQIMVAIALFILFSGLDIIGHTYFRIMPSPFEYHLEWWASFIQYSSLTTGMFWVFNQFIPIALIILLIYNERNIRSFGFWVALSLFFSPYPTAGIGIFMVAYACSRFISSPDKRRFWLEEIFSIPNIIGVFWLLPIVVLYFITNSDGMDGWHYVFDSTTPQRLLLFMVIEFLLYVVILFPQYCRDIFFQTTFLSLILIPFFRLDQQNNFCMRASIPSIVMLAVFTIRFLLEQRRSHPLKTALLCCVFIIGALTPLTEFYRGIYFVTKEHKLALVQDGIHTLNGAYIPMPLFGWDVNHQFTAKNYRTDIFWQHISKKLPK